MGLSRRPIVATVAIASGLLFGAMVSRAADPELLTNVGFESGSSGWSVGGVAMSSAAAHSGTKGAHFPPGGSPSVAQNFNLGSVQEFQVSFWARMNAMPQTPTWGGIKVSISSTPLTASWLSYDEEDITGYLYPRMGQWVYVTKDYFTFGAPSPLSVTIHPFTDGTFDFDLDEVSVKPISLPRVKIMAVGDSTTESEDGMASFRYWLWKMLENGGYHVNFDGPKKGVAAGTSPQYPDNMPLYLDFDRDHFATWGTGADSVAAACTPVIAKYQPDICLVHLGTNDMGNGATPQDTLTHLSNLIDNIRAGKPNVTILLCQLIPTPYIYNQVVQLNALIPGLASQKTTAQSPIVVVDQWTGFLPEDGAPHPGTPGQIKIATRYYQALQTVLQVNSPSVSPRTINDLAALSGPNPGSVRLTWTSPGNDDMSGNLSGRYAVEYATSTPDAWNMNNAQVSISTSSVVPGTPQSAVISGLAPGVSHLFHLWTQDADEYWSGMSNEASATAAPQAVNNAPPAAPKNLRLR